MQSVQVAKASAPWRTKQAAPATDASRQCGCVISRERLLGARAHTAQKNQMHSDASGLRSMSSNAVSSLLEAPAKEEIVAKPLPPHIAPPPGLEPVTQQEQPVSDKPSLSKSEQPVQPSSEPISGKPEYQVLLQNLPQRLMKETMLRTMVKEADLKDVKKLAFRSDGRVLITLRTHEALCRCIGHFNGLPWFHAPSCSVPCVLATQVLKLKNEKSSSTNSASMWQQQSPNLSAEAPSFVPGAMQWTAKIGSSSKKLRDRDCSSNMSTDGGASSDEASCGYDSEADAPIACA